MFAPLINSLPGNVLALALHDVLAHDLRDGHRLSPAVPGGRGETHGNLDFLLNQLGKVVAGFLGHLLALLVNGCWLGWRRRGLVVAGSGVRAENGVESNTFRKYTV